MARWLWAGGELLCWWAALTLVWSVLVGTLDTLEWLVGAGAGAVAAVAARGARRVAGDR
ncbi:hypothetical protein [Streptomyces sp. NPDC002067]